MNSRSSSRARLDVAEVAPQPTLEALTQDFDAAGLEDMDPSTADGYRVLYDREAPIELRIQDDSGSAPQVGTLEALRVKILLQGNENSPEDVKLELTSENDLFFHYNHHCEEEGFKTVQEQQKLMVEFADYTNVLIRMLNSCIKEPHSHIAVFIMKPDGHARLDFIQNMEYKFVELLSVNFNRSSDEMVQRTISYRYNALKSRLKFMQSRLQEVNQIVKVKNPSLLLQLQKSIPASPVPSSMSSFRKS